MVKQLFGGSIYLTFYGRRHVVMSKEEALKRLFSDVDMARAWGYYRANKGTAQTMFDALVSAGINTEVARQTALMGSLIAAGGDVGMMLGY